MVRSKKDVKQKAIISTQKKVMQQENPESIMKRPPSWSFSRCDRDGCWGINKDRLKDCFWEKILPKLANFETMRWADILIAAKKQHHTIIVSDLNVCAQTRLKELQLFDLDEIVSLRIEGTTRIYGFLSEATFVILWYDDNHGDNADCVCRSYKK